jgi:hypothetical protein
MICNTTVHVRFEIHLGNWGFYLFRGSCVCFGAATVVVHAKKSSTTSRVKE